MQLAKLVLSLRSQGVSDPAVLGALEKTPRDLFTPELFKERAYWLWLTSHRLGDLRRLVRQYQRAETSTFPSGAYSKGGLYGADLNFPVPFEEQNNPKFKQCIDRGA